MTVINPQVYESLANLLEYPQAGWNAQLEACRRVVVMENADLAIDFLRFYKNIVGFTLSGLQELYTQTFDLNPVCALEANAEARAALLDPLHARARAWLQVLQDAATQ